MSPLLQTKKNDRKKNRTRTVLSQKQLDIMIRCYTANPRPDALMKEQLVEMTGLSNRVIRVWYQNKRCKDNKRQKRMLEKHMQPETVRLFFYFYCPCSILVPAGNIHMTLGK